ncbi:MAG: Cache 3/Cache 2 fusion domain-containing protein, partial [Firmicutes bacterium]|nr:Cache 3/Cache 2 fusion domain-containing protein [Bacillota bacterium]
MKFSRNSLVFKVTSILLLVMSIVFIIVGYINFSQSKQMLINEIEQKVEIQSNALATQVDDYFRQKAIEIKQMGTNNSIINYFKTVQTRDDALTNPYYPDVLYSLNEMKKMDSNLGLVWVSSEKGNFLIGDGGLFTNPEWDIETRSWRKFALESDEPVFSDPFISLATGKEIINIVNKVTDDNEVIGYVAADLLMDEFSEIMESYKVGKTGYTILVGKNGTIMYHPEKELIFNNKIQDLEGDLGNIGKNMIAGETDIKMINYKNQKVYVSYSKVPTSGWSVATVLPVSEAQSAMKS